MKKMNVTRKVQGQQKMSDSKRISNVKRILILFLAFNCFMVLAACTSTQTDGNGADVTEEEFNTLPEGNGSEPTETNGVSDSDGANDSEAKNGQESDDQPVSSPYTFEYPEAVRGIYVSGHSAGGSRLDRLMELIHSTELNAMVIDVKDDFGYITFQTDNPNASFYSRSRDYIKNIDELMGTLEENNIYPIARVTVFKDSVLAREKPEWSFLENGQVWKNGREEAFVNPLLQEVWDYNIEVAKMAAEHGFREIQFDYVRFPEGFEKRETSLEYAYGNYPPPEVKDEEDQVYKDYAQARVQAVTDFVSYAREELEDYDVDVAVDIFGYAAAVPEAPGIGQNFSRISEHVDVISSMIYPSHWGPGNFGIDQPDLEPYRLTREYMKMENSKLADLELAPVSRPWIQDFTASWLGEGNYQPYGVAEIEAQIQALNEAGVWEFLLWNAGNEYTQGVNYLPLGRPEGSQTKNNEDE